MAGSVVRSSTTSASSAAKQRASKKSASAKPSRPAALAGSATLSPAATADNPVVPRSRGRQGVAGGQVRGSKANRPSAGERLIDSLFTELARVAEMSAVERQLRDFGFRCIAGTDEVGRGCLAGPVVAACVILDDDPTLFGVNDSKQLDADDRLAACGLVLSRARAFGIGVVEPDTIDRINILRASKLAMQHAIEHLPLRPDVLLLDAVTLESVEMPQIPLIGGDRRSISIAAASVVAKVYRDLLMESYDELYPVYDFKHNRGYGTESHQAALRLYGPSPIHRRSFEGVDEPRSLFGRQEDGGTAR